MNSPRRLTSILCALCVLTLLSVPSAKAQSSLVIYGDSSLGFQNWGSATVSFTNKAPVHSWNNSISMTISSGSAAGLNLEHLIPFDTSLYTSLSFWIHGGTTGGQRLRVYARLDGGTYLSGSAYTVPPLGSNSWQQITVPLATLSAANRTNLTGFVLEGTTGAAQPTFYVDDIALIAALVWRQHRGRGQHVRYFDDLQRPQTNGMPVGSVSWRFRLRCLPLGD